MTYSTRVFRADAGARQPIGMPRQRSRTVAPAAAATRVCLVGAGSIAAVHAEVLSKLTDVRVVALVEPSVARAEKFAKRWEISTIHPDLTRALNTGGFDTVHILTPPDTHAALAQQCIDAGVSVFVEKPLAERIKDAEALVAAAQVRGLTAAVNQNFVFHPAFARLRAALAEAGPLRDVHVAYNVPLRQLAARQFGSWMFHEPGNILLEQAVHPLSQIVALLGPIDSVRAWARPGKSIAKDLTFHPTAEAIFAAGETTAHLQFAVGRAFPFWQMTVVCDDAVLVADILNNRFYRLARGPGLEPVDALLQSFKTAGQIAGSGLRNAADYALSLARLKPRSDPFYRSMQGSIAAFYRAVHGRTQGPLDQPTDLAFGADIVAVCAEMARQCFGATPRTPSAPAVVNTADVPVADVAVLGGTGFIGTATTARLAAAGYRVRVMARNTRNLAEVFHLPGVHVMRGDITRPEDVAAAVKDVPVVVNLAHGGGGETFAEIERALVGGARTVAECCLAAGVTKLIHVGSIAGLYLGDGKDVITGATPPDPRSTDRADYARAKADADRLLMAMHRDRGLPVCILRPGVVVGEGTSPFHSGLGMFNNEQHCVGWNGGDNPLPFVLVEDVADAIVAAVGRDQVIGRSYNLVGDVRMSSRGFVAALSERLRRPLRFHASSVAGIYLADLGKWLIKRAGGRAAAPPSLRDIRSRGLVARFDCSDAVRDLGWRPVSDRETFVARAFAGL